MGSVNLSAAPRWCWSLLATQTTNVSACGNYPDNHCILCKKLRFRRINKVIKRGKRPRKELLGGVKRWLYVHLKSKMVNALSARRWSGKRPSHPQKYQTSLWLP